MEVIKINANRIKDNKIICIARALEKGKVVILPTDTSYGMAVNALDIKAIDKVYKIKGRQKKRPLSIIVKNISQAGKYCKIDKRTKNLYIKFLPGRLTMVVRGRIKLPSALNIGNDSIGIRMPKNKIIERVMKKIDFPITATSANMSGEKDLYSAEEAIKKYKNKKNRPDIIIDAGILPKNKPSTIIDLTGKKVKLLRSGPIKLKDVVNSLKS